MVYLAGFLLGCITSIGSFVGGFFFYRRWCTQGHPPSEPKAFFPAFRKPLKKKPKFVSEEEQWKREQKQTPSDPTYKP